MWSPPPMTTRSNRSPEGPPPRAVRSRRSPSRARSAPSGPRAARSSAPGQASPTSKATPGLAARTTRSSGSTRIARRWASSVALLAAAVAARGSPTRFLTSTRWSVRRRRPRGRRRAAPAVVALATDAALLSAFRRRRGPRPSARRRVPLRLDGVRPLASVPLVPAIGRPPLVVSPAAPARPPQDRPQPDRWATGTGCPPKRWYVSAVTACVVDRLALIECVIPRRRGRARTAPRASGGAGAR